MDENRQVRIVLSGHPLDVEKNIDNLTNELSNVTDLDVRVRVLEPHIGERKEPATDVYIYAVDPKTNALVNMEEFHQVMTNINMEPLIPKLDIVELPHLGSPITSLNTYPTQYGSFNGTELSIMIIIAIILGSVLITALYVGIARCRRYIKFRKNNKTFKLIKRFFEYYF